MGGLRKVILITTALLAVLFGVVLYYHNFIFFVDGPENGFLLTKKREVRESVYLPAFYVHILTGSLVLIAGVFQFSSRLRKRRSGWHRSSGKIYAFVILIFTAPSGLIMSIYASGGFPAAFGFGLLAVLWWLTTWKGYTHARSKDWGAHRRFMLRSYALTFAAVTLRLYSFIFALAGLRGEMIYILIAWLSWVPSLIVVELWIWQTERAYPKPSRPVGTATDP